MQLQCHKELDEIVRESHGHDEFQKWPIIYWQAMCSGRLIHLISLASVSSVVLFLISSGIPIVLVTATLIFLPSILSIHYC